MKTSVTLFSPDRELFGNRIKHITKPSMLCLSDLQIVYEENMRNFGWKERKIKQILNYKESPQNTERLYYALKERGFIKVDFSTFIEEIENKTLISVLKEMKLYVTKGRGDNKTIYCYPDIFVLVALELDPMLYGKTVVWLTDSLVVRRIYAADNNNILKNRMFFKWGEMPETTYMGLNIELNRVVFGEHFKDIRNTGTIEQLRDLENLQASLAFLIDNDYVNTIQELFEAINRENKKRYGFERSYNKNFMLKL